MIKINKNSADWAELLQLAFRLFYALQMRTIDEAVSMGRWNPTSDSYLPPG